MTAVSFATDNIDGKLAHKTQLTGEDDKPLTFTINIGGDAGPEAD
jgi:hypothetical protein